MRMGHYTRVLTLVARVSYMQYVPHQTQFVLHFYTFQTILNTCFNEKNTIRPPLELMCDIYHSRAVYVTDPVRDVYDICSDIYIYIGSIWL